MSEVFLYYIWSIYENVEPLVSIVRVIIFSYFAFLSIAFIFKNVNIDANDADDTYLRLKKFMIPAIILGILLILIPSKRNLAVMLIYPSAKAAITKTINSKTANKFQEILYLYLDKQLKSLEEGGINE